MAGRLRSCLILIAAAGVLGAPLTAQPTHSPPVRPQIASEDQYHCLLANLDRLQIGKRGNLFDLSKCPPTVVLNSYPVAPDGLILLKPDDIACLKKANRSTKIAVKQPSGQVALYLQPCGR